MPTITFRITYSNGDSVITRLSANVTLAQFDEFVTMLPYDASFEIINVAS